MVEMHNVTQKGLKCIVKCLILSHRTYTVLLTVSSIPQMGRQMRETETNARKQMTETKEIRFFATILLSLQKQASLQSLPDITGLHFDKRK